MARIDYDRVAADFQRTRNLPLEALEAWRGALAPYLGVRLGGPVADVGAGTGTFAIAFAEWFGVRVIGVEPSAGMRREAEANARHALVTYAAGDAGHLPFRRGALGAAWLSTVIHHIPDLPLCARELGRTLQPGARVLVRSVFPGRQDAITLFRFFPEAIAVVDTFPSADLTTATFAAAGFVLEHREAVPQTSAPSLKAFLDRVKRRADTTLRSISDEAFARGVARLQDAAAGELAPAPVVDRLDLLVMRLGVP